MDADGKPLARRESKQPRSLWMRLIAALLIFGALKLAWDLQAGGTVEQVIVHDYTVRPATWLIDVLTPQVRAYAEGSTIQSVAGGLNIINGCDGTELLFILLAAFGAGPMAQRTRVLGVLFGIPVVFAVNQFRILALFYANRAGNGLFEPLHATITPIVVVLLIATYFYVWLAHGARVAPKPR